HLLGGYAGGQAQFVRVPFADVGPVKVPEGLPDERVLFLTDIFPTGYMAAENCNIHHGDVIAVWGCGPVGQFAIRSAFLLGAGQVIAIDRVPERLRLAGQAGARILDRDENGDIVEALKEMTGGRGPDACIDAVGMEAHGGPLALADGLKQAMRISSDRAMVLREVIQACRKGGTVSVPGVYGGMIDKMPWGAAFNKGLTFRMGQTHMNNYIRPLLERIERGEIDPSFVITHRLTLEEAPGAYRTFRDKQQQCIKVVLDPWQEKKAA
ncbi:MAG: zinc-binding dehydrogenase, partial [Acidobacteria bacterium]|nr:zinc-binding dehydrogenase [Acidobacteriota bacterium]